MCHGCLITLRSVIHLMPLWARRPGRVYLPPLWLKKSQPLKCLPGRQLSVAPRNLKLLMSVTKTCLRMILAICFQRIKFFLCFSTICLSLFWAFQNYFNIYVSIMSKLNRSPPSQHIVCICLSISWCWDICVPCMCYSLCLSLHFLVVGHPCVPYVWYSLCPLLTFADRSRIQLP